MTIKLYSCSIGYVTRHYHSEKPHREPERRHRHYEIYSTPAVPVSKGTGGTATGVTRHKGKRVTYVTRVRYSELTIRGCSVAVPEVPDRMIASAASE